MTKQFAIITIKDGQIVNKGAIRKLLALADGKYLFEISGADKRSNPQNNYYWQILTEYFQPGLTDLGWQHIKTKEDAHVFMADMFLKIKEVNNETREMKERTRSTTELTKAEFNVYLNELWQWAAEWLHVAIPEPNAQTMLSYDT